MNMETKYLEAKWDALTVAERTKLIKKDKSMRSPRWAALVISIASKRASELSPVQRGALADFFKA